MKLHARLVFIAAVIFSFVATHAQTKPSEGAGQTIVLFDGKNIENWHQAGPGSLELKDGTLVTHGGMGLFWHKREFGDFLLELDWMVNRPGANSGVFVRFPDPGNDPWVAVKQGHEIQICDTEKGNQTGAIYNFKNSSKIVSKEPGQWNHYAIKVVGKHYTVTLNGEQVNEFDSPDRPLRGHIGLQNHDPTSVVTFKDVKITELGGASTQPTTKQAAAAVSGVPVAAAPATAPVTAVAKAPASQPVALLALPEPVHNAVPGVVGEYFRGVKEFAAVAKATDPFLVRVDKSINFARTEGQFYETKLALNFGARWTGCLRIDTPGSYTFTINSDDAARFYIGDQLIVDNAKAEVNKDISATVKLNSGDYPIRVEFHQGPGEAGCLLYWQKPGVDKKEIIPASAFLHAKQAENITWNKDVWVRANWSNAAWKKEAGKRADLMNYGPFLSHTFQADKGNDTLKGIAIKLGKEDEAAVIFDTELLRYSVGWTGGFLNLKGVAFDGAHGPNPSPEGDIVFATKQEPGAHVGTADGKPFSDPRAKPFGPLPRDYARYKGLYRNGKQVVLSYTVGETRVFETPGIEKVNDKPVFTRAIEVGASKQPITLLITGNNKVNDKDTFTAVAYPSELKLTNGSDGRRFLTFPASSKARTYKIAIAGGGAVAQPDLLKVIGSNKPDVESLTKGGPSLWTKLPVTRGEVGKGDGPYVVDTITVPEDNPYESWMRFGGFDFFSDGRAAVCTWNGDVWIVSGIDDKLQRVTWKRFATGMFQTLGLKIVNDQVYVLGRDQITRLHDLNGDSEADFYECFNNDCEVSTSFHEFSFDLQTDSQGNFYYAKAGPVKPGGRGWQILTDHNGCMLRVSKDGSKFEVFATGLRAPNGMSVGPDDTVTTGDNEGTWTPACRINVVKKGDFIGVPDTSKMNPQPTNYLPPICWLPHGDVDNSSGCQVWDTSDRWGPFKGEMLHLSYGTCSLFKVLKENVAGTWQGGVVRFPLNFVTGICRARFNPIDGQLYVAGLRGWQTSAAKDAGLQRVRYTGKPVNMPTSIHFGKGQIQIGFTGEIDSASATDVENYAMEQWNLLWSNDYGSPEFSVENPKQKGHDPLEADAAAISADHKTITLKIDELKPVMQIKIEMKLKDASGSPLHYTIYGTINKLGAASAMPVADLKRAGKKTASTKPAAAAQSSAGTP